MVRFTSRMVVGCLLLAGVCSGVAQARAPRANPKAEEIKAALKALPPEEKAAINGIKIAHAEKVKLNNLVEAEAIAAARKKFELDSAAANAAQTAALKKARDVEIGKIKGLHQKRRVDLKKAEDIAIKKTREAFARKKKDLEAALKKLK